MDNVCISEVNTHVLISLYDSSRIFMFIF